MEEKLSTAYLVLHPEKFSAAGSTVSRLHGLVLKYVRIYQSAFDEKNVQVSVIGNSVGEVLGNPVAISTIPHTLLDNALKYSRPGSEVRIDFSETETTIDLRVTSFGPRIEADERERIFEIFYRGREAAEFAEDGAGFGLYLAQFAAHQVGTRINVQQSKEPSRFGYSTAFSVRFKRER